jgi:hypothetical protein
MGDENMFNFPAFLSSDAVTPSPQSNKTPSSWMKYHVENKAVEWPDMVSSIVVKT